MPSKMAMWQLSAVFELLLCSIAMSQEGLGVVVGLGVVDATGGSLHGLARRWRLK